MIPYVISATPDLTPKNRQFAIFSDIETSKPAYVELPFLGHHILDHYLQSFRRLYQIGNKRLNVYKKSGFLGHLSNFYCICWNILGIITSTQGARVPQLRRFVPSPSLPFSSSTRNGSESKGLEWKRKEIGMVEQRDASP